MARDNSDSQWALASELRWASAPVLPTPAIAGPGVHWPPRCDLRPGLLPLLGHPHPNLAQNLSSHSAPCPLWGES